MKRFLYLGLLSILLLGCDGEHEVFEGDGPLLLPNFLFVLSTDNARTQSELSMQYTFYLEEDLFVKWEYMGMGSEWRSDGVFIDDGVELTYDVDGERIMHDIDVKPGPRTCENLALLFQWPFAWPYGFDERPLLVDEYFHSKKAKELNLPTTQDDNELMAEVVKYKYKGSGEWNKISGKYYYYVGVKNVAISADRPLFGCDAGVDIAHKFRMMPPPTLLLATYPTFAVTCKIEDEKPTSLTALNNSLLCAGGYAVKFAEVPAEKYDEVTFTVAMDILLPDGGERTLTGSVKVVFE